jgi:hypothetical protein
VDVGQIVAGCSLETGVSADGSFPETNSFSSTTGTFGGSGKFTVRPTTTYMPLTGNNFLLALMTPLPPNEVFFTLQSGYAADALFLATVSKINGLKNQKVGLEGVTMAEPGFLRATELMRRIQSSGAVGLRVREDVEGRRMTQVTFRSKDISEQTLTEIRELRKLLRLNPDASEFYLVYGGVAANGGEPF